ncbi:MAG TPA: response regulator transcription factor [Anaerolineae bacterium]|nr:response regulator transcription factor [Anaerolineae bacterium]
MSITIFLADDHAIVRDGLRMLLEAQPDLQVVGEATNGRDAVRQVCELLPDVTVLDITMPELNGLEAAQQIREGCETTQVIILSMHGSTAHVFEALKAGAKGYLLKASAGANVVDAVRAVHAGQRYLSPEILDRVVESSLTRQLEKLEEKKAPLARLSPREREVLQLVVEGKSSAEIAEILFLSPKTVETYRSNLMKKLELRNLPELVKFAIKHGLTPLE